jgi:Nucleotidyl transferase AbiEii toxin, Type IV TA system
MMNQEGSRWHREVMTAPTEATLGALQGASLLEHFYLAGGTGLALQFGHRLSHDLDFFSAELFDEELLLQRLQGLRGWALVARAPHTLHATIEESRITFLGYTYQSLFPLLKFQGVGVADARDIACMKLSAVASRGTKRDFVDVYIAARDFGLTTMLQWFERKYAQANYNRLHVLKSLTFFDDAEKDPMPHMLLPVDWPEVVRFFLREVPRLL